MRDKFILYKVIMLFVVTSILVACGGHDQDTKSGTEEVITIAAKSLSSSLFFSGNVQPLKTIVVTSPVDGVVDDMSFHFGDSVKKNQMLYVISSEKFKTDYRSALMQYIKAKNEFNNARSQLKESEFLHKNKLISDDDFKSKQSGYYNAQLTLVQSQDALSVMLKQLAVPGLNMDQLTIENIDKVMQAMNVQGGSQKIRITSPVPGVALLATKTSGEDIKKIEKGDQVKQGDVIAVIGDVSGLMIRISVNEFNINHLQVGQKVKVTGAAFPDIVLQGKITGLDHQGQIAAGGMPVFPVEVVVPVLTSEQQAIIHMGMSAKVEIDIDEPQKITIPINAVTQKPGGSYVVLQDAHTNKRHDVKVKTGQTTEDAVVIDSGLQVGDKIVVPG